MPEELRAAARELQEQCQCQGVKIGWTAPQNLHFTLKFLGDTDAEAMPRLTQVAEEVARSCPAHEVTVATVGAFPSPRQPRVLWVGCTTGAEQLGQLGTRLDQALAQAGLGPGERRGFVPHLTLGRVRGGHDFAELAAHLERLADSVLGDMPVDHFALMQSNLRPGQPPLYVELARLDLPPDEGRGQPGQGLDLLRGQAGSACNLAEGRDGCGRRQGQ